MTRRAAGGLSALAVLAIFFVGVPAALAITAGWPVPAADTLRAAVQLAYVPAHLIGQLGATVAWIAWGWLAVASARMALDAWADRPARSALGAGWLRPLIVQAVGGLLVLSGALNRASAWGGPTHAGPRSQTARPAASQPLSRGAPIERPQRHRPGTITVEEEQSSRPDSPRPAGPVGAPAAPDPSTVPAPAPSGETYVVQRGDNLWDIARDQLGDALRWRQIWQLNQGLPQPDGGRLADPGRIRPGWKLQLPVPAGASSPIGPPPNSPQPSQRMPERGSTAPNPSPANGRTPSPTTTGPATSAAPSTVRPATTLPAAASEPPRANANAQTPSSPAAPVTTNRSPGSERSAAPTRTGHGSDTAAPVVAIGAAGLSSAALWLGVRRWRRRRAAKMPPGWLPASPSHQIQALVEHAVEGAQGTVERLDVALRHLGFALEARLPGQVPVPVAVIVGADDTVDVIFDTDQPGEPPPPWLAIGACRWRLPAEEAIELRPVELSAPAPCPALVTIGDSPHGAVLVNLEATGGAFLDGPASLVESCCRRWALELSGAAWSAGIRVLAADSLGLPVDMPRVETLNGPALEARCQAAADWGAAAAGTLAGEGHPQARIAARLGDELAIALWPGDEPPPSSPGVVVVGSRPGGLRIELAGGRAEVPGVGEVRLVAPDDAEIGAALASGSAEAVPPPSSAIPDPATVEAGPAAPGIEPTAEISNRHAPTAQAALPGLGPTLRLLGPVEVLGVADKHRTQLVEMAALLALHREGCSWETFCQVIWRDRHDSSQGHPAVKTVRTRIAELRAWLGGHDTVISHGDILRLDGDIRVDWWRFEMLAARPETMSQALALVQGRPLEGVLDGWAERDYWVTSIEAAVIAVSLAAADAAARRGAWGQGIADAEVGLRLCPFDQRLTRAAMRAAAAGGDREFVHTLVARAEAQLDEDEGLDTETLELLRSLTTDNA